MITRANRIGGALFVALITSLVLMALSAPTWAIVGIALLVYLQMINSASLYNVHWSIVNRMRR